MLLTIFLSRKGSGESKQERDDPRDEDPREHRDDPDAPLSKERAAKMALAGRRSDDRDQSRG